MREFINRLYRFFLRIPQHLWAMLLGFTMIPLRSVGYAAIISALAVLAGLVILVIGPVVLAYLFYKSGIKPINLLLLTLLLILPVLSVAVITALALIATGLFFVTLYNVIKNSIIGLTAGLLFGMDGYKRASKELSPWKWLFDWFGSLRSQRRSNLDPDGFQRIMYELVDVVVPDGEPRTLAQLLPGAEVPFLPKDKGNLLTKKELEDAQKLINELSQKESAGSKEKSDALKTRLNQYLDLDGRLTKLRESLISVREALSRVNQPISEDDQSAIDDLKFNDEIMLTGIDVPVFLVKQYVDNGQWHDVPASGVIIDMAMIESWFNKKLRHPKHNDSMEKPPEYNGKRTRYIWYKLTETNCSAQELFDGASEIRNALKKSANTSENTNNSESGSHSPRLFRNNTKNKETEDKNGNDFTFG